MLGALTFITKKGKQMLGSSASVLFLIICCITHGICLISREKEPQDNNPRVPESCKICHQSYRKTSSCECRGSYCTLDADCCPKNSTVSTSTASESAQSMSNYMQCQKRFLSAIVNPVLVGDAYYMVSLCPANWTTDYKYQEEIGLNCSTSGGFPPISDPVTGTTFKNVYCAICHGANISNLIAWQTSLLSCQPSLKMGNITLDRIHSLCTRCSFIPPRNSNIRKNLRWCIRVVSNCQSFLYNESEYTRLNGACLKSPFEPVYQKSSLGFNDVHESIYKNFNCALCNGQIIDDLVCQYPGISSVVDLERCTGFMAPYIPHGIGK